MHNHSDTQIFPGFYRKKATKLYFRQSAVFWMTNKIANLCIHSITEVCHVSQYCALYT